MKKNVTLIGVSEAGLSIYSFSYVWSDTVYVGVMAQELVGTAYEVALSLDGSGYYNVDYGYLNVDMVEYCDWKDSIISAI